LVGRQEGIRPVKKLSADLHMAQLMPLPLNVSCFRLVVPFWYQPTQVVPDKVPLNGCVCVYFYFVRFNFTMKFLKTQNNYTLQSYSAVCNMNWFAYAINLSPIGCIRYLVTNLIDGEKCVMPNFTENSRAPQTLFRVAMLEMTRSCLLEIIRKQAG